MCRYGFVYKTTNLITGKIYIGQKRYSRNNEIKNPMPSYLGSGRKILNSISKYGRENFKREILCWCYSQKGLDDMEVFFIRYFDSMNEKIGYNLTSGGQTEIPDEMKHRYGKDNPNFGNKWSDEQKERARRIALKRNYKGENNPNFGNKWNDEQRERARKINIQKGLFKGVNNPKARKIMCVETGKIYNLMSDLVKETGYALSTICNKIHSGKKINNKTYICINNSPS